jgi:hypothetical protein
MYILYCYAMMIHPLLPLRFNYIEYACIEPKTLQSLYWQSTNA